jgi:hypothetical protein
MFSVWWARNKHRFPHLTTDAVLDRLGAATPGRWLPNDPKKFFEQLCRK